MNLFDRRSMSFSAVDDGVADAAEVLQQELDRVGEIRIPRGNYRITRTLLVSANTAIIADGGRISPAGAFGVRCYRTGKP